MQPLAAPHLLALLAAVAAATARPMLSPSHPDYEQLMDSLRHSYVDLGSPGSRDEVNFMAQNFHRHFEAERPDLALVHHPTGPEHKQYHKNIRAELAKPIKATEEPDLNLRTDWESHVKLPPTLYLREHVKPVVGSRSVFFRPPPKQAGKRMVSEAEAAEPLLGPPSRRRKTEPELHGHLEGP